MENINIFFRATCLSACIVINTSFIPFGCTDIIKTTCVPALTPYLHNGQINTAILDPGEFSSTIVSFYSGNTYRISTCANKNKELTHFEVLNPSDGLVLYSSKTQQNAHWDFKVESSRKLVINIYADKSLKEPVCAGLTVGFLH